MSRRKYARMARPKSGASKRRRSKASRSSTSGDSLAVRVGQGVLGWFKGPVGQQVMALIVIAVGIVTFISLFPNINSGRLVQAWTRFLVFTFGWAAFPIAALIVALGLLWIRHLVHRETAWRWRPFLGFELMLIGLQTLTYVLINQTRWDIVESGRGGGVVGWAVYFLLGRMVNRLITGVIMGLFVVVGAALAFDLTAKDLSIFGRRLEAVWNAWQAARAARKEERRAIREALSFESGTATYSPAEGVVISSPAHGEQIPVPEVAGTTPSRETRSKPKIY
ncbi:MAG: DNA translocase FtsK 4TM domain-containing protein, partial [Anaerolineae bacterium]